MGLKGLEELGEDVPKLKEGEGRGTQRSTNGTSNRMGGWKSQERGEKKDHRHQTRREGDQVVVLSRKDVGSG